MAEADEKKIKFDQQNLYQEENFTDLKVGSIRRLTPVKPNGEPDKGRKILFLGQSQIYTQQGPLPVQFPIEARNLQEAMTQFSEAMEEYVAHLVEEAKEFQRQERSKIIVPGAGGGPAAPGGSNIIL